MNAPRTAEDERRDALAFLAAEVGRYEREAESIPRRGSEAVFRALELERLAAAASFGRTMIAYLSRGDHEGASDR